MKNIHKHLIFLFLLLASLPILFPLFHSGFFVTDDADWMIIRFTAFHQALADGQFPVRFLPRLNFDYGYPVANFLYPGFMYLGEIFHLFKIGFIDSIKIVLGISLFGSALFTYLWLSKIFSKQAAFTGAIAYLYAPYHLYDIYGRGSVGELLALAVAPFLLWCIEKKNWPLFAVGIGCFIMSHNTLAVLFFPLVIGYLIIKNGKRWKEYKNGFIAIILGVGLSAFFWFPALHDLRYTVFFQTQVSEWQHYFADISLIGIFNAVVIAAGILLIFLRKYIKKLHGFASLLYLFLISGVLAIFLSAQVSEFIWSAMPISFIQFPFRLLSVEILSASFITAILIHVIHNKKMAMIFTVLTCLVIIASALPVLSRISYVDRIDGYYATNEDTTTVKKEYMPLWVQEVMSTRPEKKIESEEAKISEEVVQSNKIIFKAFSAVSSTVRINTIYFPGWMAKIDGKNAIISYDNPHGVIHLSLPQGEHQVEVYFTETPERIAADVVSLLSLILLSIWFSKKHLYG